MKKMIRMAVMATAMFMAVTTVTQAQDAAQQGRGRGRGGVQMLLQGITVDSGTTAKIQAVAAKYQADIGAARQAQDTAKVADLSKKRNEEIKSLLTDDQKKAFDANVEAAAARGRGPRPPLR